MSDASPSSSLSTSAKPATVWFRKICGRLIELPNDPDYLSYAERQLWTPVQAPSQQ